MTEPPHEDRIASDAERFQLAAKEPSPPFWREFAEFLVHSPSWWLTPIILIVLLLGLAVAFIPAEALPFIYTLW